MIGALPLETAFVLRSYNDESGRPVCDLSRTGVGAVEWARVPVMVLGGGPGRYLLLPAAAPSRDELLTDGAEVVIGFFANHRPVILGTLGHPRAGLAKTDEADPSDNANLTPKIDRNTAGLAWDGALLALRGGNIALEAADGKNVSAQLNGGIFRVAQNGEANDWAVLARALVTALAPLYTKVNQQDAQIAALTTKLTEVCGKVTPPSIPPVPYASSETEPLETGDVAARALRVSSELE